MKRNKNYILPTDSLEIKSILSHAGDLYAKAIFSNRTFFTKFLTPPEADAVFSRFPKGECPIGLFGGYEGAERVVASFGECETKDYPISIVSVTNKGTKELSHRDYLGTVLSLGIKREMIGDIIIDGKDAYIFALDEIAPFICDNLFKISNSGVSCKILAEEENFEILRQYETFFATVSSLRLDSVVSAACKKSRSQISALFPKGLVLLNYKETSSVSAPVKDGDILTVRGFGKFLIKTDGALTKKGRIHIEINKYA